MILLEELFEGDLNGMLSDIISVDEFVSKIDDDTIVIAFYSSDEDAAEDLAIFLERSHIENILDSEVSTTPNRDAQYLTFVEIANKHFIETFKEIIELVSYLNNNKKWKIKNLRILPKLVPYTEKNIKILYKKIKDENDE